jgi:hypothetical protein
MSDYDVWNISEVPISSSLVKAKTFCPQIILKYNIHQQRGDNAIQLTVHYTKHKVV